MVSHEKAKMIAVAACEKIKPYCNLVNIAGSVRRGMREVKDIEIVCLPKYISTGSVDLFGNDSRAEVISTEFITAVESLGKILKGKPTGRYIKIEARNPHGGAIYVSIDMFMPQPADYFRQYAIRTGCADYAHKVLATKWSQLGWVGTKDGLRRRDQCKASTVKDGKESDFKCVVDDPELPPVWESEEHFFTWLGIKHIPPAMRAPQRFY